MSITEIPVIGPSGAHHKDVTAVEGVLAVAVFVEAGSELTDAEVAGSLV